VVDLLAGHCFAACVGSILRLGPEAQADLMSLPPGFWGQPAAMAEYSDKLEVAFGVWLRQLNCPPISQRPWIAAVRTDTPSGGHAVVARNRTVLFDPADAECEGPSWWGRTPPSSFGLDLIGGFELVEV
jgi:hypothetical protein